MLIGFICFLIFLFCVYQLAKDDFIFLRKGVTLEMVFDSIFLGLPVVLFVARIFYIFLHPSIHYLNPLVFLALPYFPGLSLVGGIVGAWLFIVGYTAHKKIPQARLLDILGISFLLALGAGIFLQGILFLFSSRLVGIEEIGRSLLGLFFACFLLFRFLKSTWTEGAVGYLAVASYCLLALLSVGFMLLTHKHVLLLSLVLTLVLLFLSLLFALFKMGVWRMILGK